MCWSVGGLLGVRGMESCWVCVLRKGCCRVAWRGVGGLEGCWVCDLGLGLENC